MKKKHMVYCMKFRFTGGPLDGGKWFVRCTSLPEENKLFQWYERNRYLYKSMGAQMISSRTMLIEFDYCGIKEPETYEKTWVMRTS